MPRAPGRSVRAAAAALLSALAACAATPPVPGAGVPSPERIAGSERARAEPLRTLHATGVAEIRWSDRDGAHFEQGDLDLRWAEPGGIAVSVSKFGDRHAWLGSDGRRWWRFDLKARPPAVASGPLDGGAGGARPLEAFAAAPQALGLRPLLPVPGAGVSLRDGLAWVEVQVGSLPGVRGEAGFDPATCAPRVLALRPSDGPGFRVEYGELMAVRTVGAAEGAWPRIPRRITARRAGDDAAIAISIGMADADPAAADRPALYDLDALRTRLAPEVPGEPR